MLLKVKRSLLECFILSQTALESLCQPMPLRSLLVEELVRVFLLTGLWSFANHLAWTAVAIIIAAVLVGLVHWSQGPYGIVTIAIKSIVTGMFYYRRRRLLPLVFAHVLYDGLQVGLLLLTYPEQ